MVKKNKVNFNELVAEANIQRTIKELEELSNSDAEIRAIKEKTNGLVTKMLEAAEAGNEEKRREYRNELVVLNLRLVTQVLKKYGYFSQDKFQNGCIGLLKAAETFNPERGVPFANYACFCIETEVRLAFRRMSRTFEGKKEGFLDSLDAPATLNNGDDIDRHDTIADPFAVQEFDELINEAEVDTLFYDIIIPCIEEYGTRAKDIDMALWRQLEIQYFLELSMEQSQRQRITLTEMARRLGTTTQNMRVRHQKVMKLIRERCRAFGYNVEVSPHGAARVVITDVDEETLQKLRERNKK